MKPAKCPAKETKMKQETEKRGWQIKGNEKSEDRCVTFKAKISKFYFLHARTSQANILHMNQKDEKRTTWKQLCGKF